jgi:hypothetical protein
VSLTNRLNALGTSTTLSTSKAAPTSDMFLTMQSIAPLENSIDLAFNNCNFFAPLIGAFAGMQRHKVCHCRNSNPRLRSPGRRLSPASDRFTQLGSSAKLSENPKRTRPRAISSLSPTATPAARLRGVDRPRDDVAQKVRNGRGVVRGSCPANRIEPSTGLFPSTLGKATSAFQ